MMQFTGWFLQRITGIFLVALLGVHMIFTHFVTPQMPITLYSIQLRMSNTVLMMVNYLLLYLALFHGLLGLRVILMDLAPKSLNLKVVSIILAIVGICFGVLGTSTLIKLTA